MSLTLISKLIFVLKTFIREVLYPSEKSSDSSTNNWSKEVLKCQTFKYLQIIFTRLKYHGYFKINEPWYYEFSLSVERIVYQKFSSVQ